MGAEAALFVAAVFFSIYVLLCGIQCGAALVRLFPRLSMRRAKQQAWPFGPKWEASNAFLLLGFATFGIFFANAINAVGEVITPYVSAVLIAMVVRVLAFSFVFYKKVPAGLSVANAAFVVACFSVPLALACLGYYVLNGVHFWDATNGWVVIAAALTSVAAIGLAPALSGYGSKHYWLLSCVVYIFAFAPILLAWGNMPYLIYKTLTVDQAYSAPLYGDLILITLLLSIPVLGLGFLQMTQSDQRRGTKRTNRLADE